MAEGDSVKLSYVVQDTKIWLVNLKPPVSETNKTYRKHILSYHSSAPAVSNLLSTYYDPSTVNLGVKWWIKT